MKYTSVRWIHTPATDTNAVLAYAASELARYAHELTGDPWEVIPVGGASAEPGSIWLGLCDRMPAAPGGDLAPALWDDGYAIWQDGESAYIAGQNARSVPARVKPDSSSCRNSPPQTVPSPPSPVPSQVIASAGGRFPLSSSVASACA